MPFSNGPTRRPHVAAILHCRYDDNDFWKGRRCQPESSHSAAIDTFVQSTHCKPARSSRLLRAYVRRHSSSRVEQHLGRFEHIQLQGTLYMCIQLAHVGRRIAIEFLHSLL
jgi:hypothetical protein